MKKEMKQKMNKSLIEGPASIFWLNEFDSESMEKLIKAFDLDPNQPNLIVVLNPGDMENERWIALKNAYIVSNSSNFNVRNITESEINFSKETHYSELPDSPMKEMLENWVKFLNKELDS